MKKVAALMFKLCVAAALFGQMGCAVVGDVPIEEENCEAVISQLIELESVKP